MKGGNALKPIKSDRWDWRQYWDEDPARPGKSYAPKAAWLDQDIKTFDPGVFGISPREAACMDPQQRLLLESTWEAFEDAGVPVERMAGSRTGVFIGGFCLDHLLSQTKAANLPLVDAHSPGGVMMTVLSNRISHAFDLRGPSLTIDTACSSSLVAIHYACQSLRSGESELALAGGVNVMGRPEFPVIMSKGHFLSHHGECHAFDETAAGYARGEGAGVFLIKPLEKAIAAGDVIHAVIRGSGVNSDGRTEGLSLPSGEAQGRLIREVYERAGVAPRDVDYVEAHGTGTQAGDPAELAALNENFGEGRDRPLRVGSVKTNVGHLEAAAGVAGMLKVIGVLKNRKIPKNLHFTKPNPRIPFADYALEVVGAAADLPGAAERATLYAGVNGFGYGGTNAHVLLESAPVGGETAGNRAVAEGLRVVPFSAAGEAALRDLTGKFAFLLGGGEAVALDDLAHTAAFRRSHLGVRCAAVCDGVGTLRDQLIAASTGQPAEGMVMAGKPVETGKGLVFVFTGMGPQWWAMGRELMEREPIVKATVEEVDGVFEPLAGWSLKAAMLASEAESRMAHTDLAQPANFALQVALFRLWEARGIRPAAVVGHSVGEVSAAYVAGVYSMEEAVLVSYHRSRLQQTTAGLGAMLAVGCSEKEANSWIGDRGGVAVAAVNSFDAVTLSGDRVGLDVIAAELEAAGVFNKFLRVEVAYHSPQMDPLEAELLEVLAPLNPKPARLPLYSTAYGEVVEASRWDAGYWWQNVRHAVRFADAAKGLMEAGFAAFLEVGPHPVLGNSIKECAATLGREVAAFHSLKRKEDEERRMAVALAELYVAGFDPDWSAVAPADGRMTTVPTYPWKRQLHWLESERSLLERVGRPGPVYLSRPVQGNPTTWEVEINRNYFPFLFDHGVQDQTVFAGMGYVEAALTVGRECFGGEAFTLENVSFERVLIVDPMKIQCLVSSFERSGGRFEISSRTDGDAESMQLHCRGRILPQAEPVVPRVDLDEWRERCGDEVAIKTLYDHLGARGLDYGDAFRPALSMALGPDRFVMKIDSARVAGEVDHLLHPSLFDAALQAVLYRAGEKHLFVPSGFERFEYFGRPTGEECFAVGELISQTATRIRANAWLTDADGNVVAHAHGIALQSIEMGGGEVAADVVYDWGWKVVPRDGEPGGGEIVLLGGGGALLEAVAGRLPGGVIGESAGDALASGRRRFLIAGGSDETVAGLVAEAEAAVDALRVLAASGHQCEVIFVTVRSREVVDGEGTGSLGGAAFAALGMVAENEHATITSRAIDLPDLEAASLDFLVVELERNGADVALRAGQRWECGLEVRRSEEAPSITRKVALDEPVALTFDANGKVASLAFESVERREPGEGELEIRVHRAALNYKDLLKVEGKIHPVALEDTFWGTGLGMECAGVVTRVGSGSEWRAGDRVVTIVPGAFRTYATIPGTYAVRIPDGLGFDVAGMPVVYLTAYRGLIDVAGLAAGERVLIHHGTGGLGLAAINIAKWRGAEIFATAGSEEKREMLRGLGVKHVYSSRTLDFGAQIRTDTDGAGIDVVLSAQTGQAMHVSLGLLRTGGRFIEVGKKDIAEDNGLPMRAFNRNLTFASVDVDRLALERPELMRATLTKVMGHFEVGDFGPGEVTTFEAAKVGDAFELIARSRHVGKVLVDLERGTVEATESRAGAPLLRRDGSYLITGGTSGFGLATARWMAAGGAGSLVLASRSGSAAPGIDAVVAELESLGSVVEVVAVDVADAAATADLIARLTVGERPLRGVVHGAMVLDDVMMADLTSERFRRVFLPKAGGALNLAAALGSVRELDFVVFDSSVSAIVGNPGQTSYVVANALLDALARKLRATGVPAVSINWGALAESGVVARDERLGDVLAAAGIAGLTDAEAFDAMERAIRSGRPQVGAFKVDWKRWAVANPRRAEDPRFRGLVRQAQDGEGGDAASALRLSLDDVPTDGRIKALEEHLQEVLANVLKMPKDEVPLNRKMNEIGVDSLMVLELGLGIRERIGVEFSAMEFLKGPTLKQLSELAVERLWRN